VGRDLGVEAAVLRRVSGARRPQGAVDEELEFVAGYDAAAGFGGVTLFVGHGFSLLGTHYEDFNQSYGKCN
jgi:hypothetical protein